MEKSKTQQALDYLDANPGTSHYKVCKVIGLSQSVLSRAVKTRRENEERARFLQRGGYYVPR